MVFESLPKLTKVEDSKRLNDILGLSVGLADTYGPVFRYTRTFPRFTDGEGLQTTDRIQVKVSPCKDTVDITDLGDIAAIDAATAFGVEAKDGELRLADVSSVCCRYVVVCHLSDHHLCQIIHCLAIMCKADVRKDKEGVTYYQWKLDLPTDGVVLLSACVSGGGLYVLSLDSNAEQWSRNQDAIQAAWRSFAVAPAEGACLAFCHFLTID